MKKYRKQLIIGLMLMILCGCPNNQKKSSSSNISSSNTASVVSNSTNSQSTSSSNSVTSTSSSNQQAGIDSRFFDFYDGLKYFSSTYLTTNAKINGITFRFDNTHADPKVPYAPVLNAARGERNNYVEIVNDLSIEITKVNFNIEIYSEADLSLLDGEYYVGLQYYNSADKTWTNAQQPLDTFGDISVSLTNAPRRIRLAFEVANIYAENIRFIINNMEIWGKGIFADDHEDDNFILAETSLGDYEALGFIASPKGISYGSPGLKFTETGCYLMIPLAARVDSPIVIRLKMQLNGGTDNQAGRNNIFSVVGLNNAGEILQASSLTGIYNNTLSTIEFFLTDRNIEKIKLEYTLKYNYGGNYQIATIEIERQN